MNRILIAKRILRLARFIMTFKDFVPAQELDNLLKMYARHEHLNYQRRGDKYLVHAEEGGYAQFTIKVEPHGVALKYALVGYDGENEGGGKFVMYHAAKINRGWEKQVKDVIDRISRSK